MENVTRWLASVSPMDTSAFFKYLAKEDGRKSKSTAYSCAAPLKDKQGERKFRDKEKCALLADFFEDKLKSPNAKSEDLTRCQPTHKTVAPKAARPRPAAGQKSQRHRRYKRKMTGTHRKFEEVGVRKAINGLAKKKAAGNDGYSA